MSNGGDLLEALEQWYLPQCEGDGEHMWGVKIDTLDNPGRTIAVDLQTDLEGRRPVGSAICARRSVLSSRGLAPRMS
jgi:Immunity protein 53